MASTQEMQRRAKARKAAEAALLNASTSAKKSVLLKVIAHRHTKTGTEHTAFQLSIEKHGLTNKDKLLQVICGTPWLHKPPVEAIAAYLLQTQTYAMVQAMSDEPQGFDINFYDVGADEDFPARISCRAISAFPAQHYHTMMRAMMEELAEDKDMDVKDHSIQFITPSQKPSPCDVTGYTRVRNGKTQFVRAHKRG